MIKLRLAILFLLVVCTSATSLLQKHLLDKTILRHTEQKTGSFPVPDKKYGAFYMEMPLDHFNDTNRKTFDNRYWMNSDYYKSNGPIILYNVGESAADRAAMFVKVSTMAQLAEKLNGILIIMEHRFYGSSGPEVNAFFHTKEDLETFNTKQALADMAYLISNIEFEKINVPPVPKTKAVVYGCSYSGSLAAWAKDTYPELFFAAVSSSAPVQADVDFYQYFDPIMRYGPKQCISALQKVIAYIDQILFHGSQDEVTKVKKLFYSQNLYDQTFGQSKVTELTLKSNKYTKKKKND
ncbi:serine carboxypeptidase S28-domain-containing protein [Pilaira anomala]|nr:serine carboxypeptidase S28-domain-containing protein [Pilaira anomala]